jgi:hypothetical protein
MELFWQNFKCKVNSYYLDDTVIYLIPTLPPTNNSNEKYFIVVHDDAHQISTGITEILSETEIEEKYKINNKNI